MKLQIKSKSRVSAAEAITEPATQRHSTTSGTDVVNASKPKTWSVVELGEKAGRGGAKHRKGGRDGARARGPKNGSAKRKERNGTTAKESFWRPSGANAVSIG
jgi:hypothetical protein